VFCRLNVDLPKGKNTFPIHGVKILFQKFHLKCICLFLSSKSKHYQFLMCFGDSTKVIISLFGDLLMDIFIHSSYLMKHLVFLEVNIQYQQVRRMHALRHEMYEYKLQYHD
jgi:hypothetical protein